MPRPLRERVGPGPAAVGGRAPRAVEPQRHRTAQALLVAAVTFTGFLAGLFDDELALALDRLIIFCGIGPP